MTSTHSSSPIKRGSAPSQKASDSVNLLKEFKAVTQVSFDIFSTHYLPASGEQPQVEPSWTREQCELVESIKRVQTGREIELYTDSAPLLRLCNSVSKSVFDSLANPSGTALVFYPCHNTKIAHPFSGPSLSPDIVVLSPDKAVLESLLASPNAPCPELPKDLNWSDIVAIGEAKVDKEAKYQTGNYLRNHLQLRPDLHSVLGFSAKSGGYSLFYHDASVIQHTPSFEWAPGPLHAFVRQLYQGFPYDPSIVNLDPKPKSKSRPKTLRPSWAIRIGPDIFVVVSAKPDPGLGQRRFTAIARHVETRCLWFIKDFYHDHGRRFYEGTLYDKVHKDQVLPGLMRVEHHGYVLNVAGSVIKTTECGLGPNKTVPSTRSKMRVATRDVGQALSKIKTLSEFLRVMYDACVVQRNMYRKSKILHRDISDSNIMIAPEGERLYESYVGGYDAVKYLNQVLEPTEQPRPACLVIDLGHGADLEIESEDSQVLAARTGTPKFISRSISKGKLLSRRINRFEGVVMPTLNGTALQLYTSWGDSEYQKYNQSVDPVLPLPSSTPSLGAPKFAHRLFHDAESTFWVMTWFLARSSPKGYKKETTWDPELTPFIEGMESHYPGIEHIDARADFTPEGWEKILHPKLRLHMAPMLSQMHDYIFPEWGYRLDLDPEHVHEALMRLLLLEIVRIRDKDADVELDAEARTLPTKLKSSPSFSNSLTTTASLGAPTNPKKRSRSQEDDDNAELDASLRPSPRQIQLQLNGTADPDVDSIEKLLAVARDYQWAQMTEWLKRPDCAPPIGSPMVS